MVIDCKPLWHTLLDRNMSKTELRLKAGISTRQLAKPGKTRMSAPRRFGSVDYVEVPDGFRIERYVDAQGAHTIVRYIDCTND